MGTRSIPGACWTAVLAESATGSVRGSVSKDKVESEWGEHLTPTLGLHMHTYVHARHPHINVNAHKYVHILTPTYTHKNSSGNKCH